jgi:hypothetical protein
LYSHFYDKRQVVDFEREYRFSHRPNKSLERTREGYSAIRYCRRARRSTQPLMA